MVSVGKKVFFATRTIGDVLGSSKTKDVGGVVVKVVVVVGDIYIPVVGFIVVDRVVVGIINVPTKTEAVGSVWNIYEFVDLVKFFKLRVVTVDSNVHIISIYIADIYAHCFTTGTYISVVPVGVDVTDRTIFRVKPVITGFIVVVGVVAGEVTNYSPIKVRNLSIGSTGYIDVVVTEFLSGV